MQVEKPRAFIFSRQPYQITAARLPKSLSDSGWVVASMCTEDSLLWKTRFVEEKNVCPKSPRPLFVALIRAFKEWKPDFVIPGDRWSLYYLRGMARSLLVRMAFPGVADLVRRSLGHSDASWVLDSKRALLDIACTLDEVHTPRDQEVRSAEHALSLLQEEYEFPVVIKQDLNSGGAGVWICERQEDVMAAFEELNRSGSEGSYLHSLWKMYNQTPFMRNIDKPGKVSLQEFIEGDPYLHSFVALEGKVLGGNTARRELPYSGPNSPHCRYWATKNEEIRKAAEAIVRKTGFSGFGCVDFMVHRETNTSYLIECNPFPVNVAHLGHVLGEDLCKALRHGLTHSASSLSEYQTEKESTKEMAVLFPYELIRDPESVHILIHPCDVPFDDPKLLRAMQERFDIPHSAIDRLKRSAGSY